MRNMRSMGGMYGMGMYGGETPELQGGRRRSMGGMYGMYGGETPELQGGRRRRY
jgi:hypothetical protein